MRNPKNSWDNSDSGYTGPGYSFEVGDKDLTLMQTLSSSGSDHAKFRRMIVLYIDILAPLYWWKEFDTYKVGTVANSCSTMHTLMNKSFVLDDFSHEKIPDDSVAMGTLKSLISVANSLRYDYLICKEKGAHTIAKSLWYELIQILPESFNQKRTVMLNYEVLTNIYHSRKNHKLDEWKDFCKWIEKLPFAEGVIYEMH